MVRRTEPLSHGKRLTARLALVLMLSVLTAAWGLAATAPAPLAATGRVVVDMGNYFTPVQESQLAQEATALGAQYQMDIAIVTTSDTGGKSARAYADDYFDENGYGVGPDRNGILFLLDYDNREAYISTSGSGIRYLTDQRIDQILDAVMDAGLSSGRNFEAARAFLSRTAAFLQAGIPSGQYNEAERPRSITLVEGLLGLLGAGGTGLGFFATTRRSYKGRARPNIFEFRGNSIVSMGITTDNLINSYVSTRHIPPPPPPGGGGFSGRSTTHTSGGGRTHGGGGRGF